MEEALLVLSKMSPHSMSQDNDVDVERDAPDGQQSQRFKKDDGNLDEFTRLTKFVSTYRESDFVNPDEGEVRVRRIWYAPWRKRKFRWKHTGGTRSFPEDWLLTDIRQGLSDSEVTHRRNTAGFNELAAEKENLFAKFFSYFQGPILYGEN